MIYDQANTPSLSQWLGASLFVLAHLPHWVALFHASGGSNLRSSGSIYPQYSMSNLNTQVSLTQNHLLNYLIFESY